MSGMGHKPVPIPENVTITQAAGRLDVTGAKGNLQVPLDAAVTVDVGADGVTITRPDDTRRSKAVQGLVRALVANAVQGVSAGFAKVLEINGVGYRAEGAGNVVRLNLGFSHPIFYRLPDGVTANVRVPCPQAGAPCSHAPPVSARRWPLARSWRYRWPQPLASET